MTCHSLFECMQYVNQAMKMKFARSKITGRNGLATQEHALFLYIAFATLQSWRLRFSNQVFSSRHKKRNQFWNCLWRLDIHVHRLMFTDKKAWQYCRHSLDIQADLCRCTAFPILSVSRLIMMSGMSQRLFSLKCSEILLDLLDLSHKVAAVNLIIDPIKNVSLTGLFDCKSISSNINIFGEDILSYHRGSVLMASSLGDCTPRQTSRRIPLKGFLEICV